ncbi:hypothetical protein L1887_49729 [Cichorium endivia]|nr:hypothetical protein L1887_49729 [Cichorium endivia]
MESGGAGAEPSSTRTDESVFFASKGVGSDVRTVGRIFRAKRLPEMRAALESFAPCSSPAGVDEIAERRRSQRLDRKAGKARCSAATKFTGQDGLAKARRVSRTPSSGTRHSLSSLRQQDSLLPSARVHCPASKALPALSQPFGDLLPPRVSFGAKASSCFPLGTGTCAHSVSVGLCQRNSHGPTPFHIYTLPTLLRAISCAILFTMAPVADVKHAASELELSKLKENLTLM